MELKKAKECYQPIKDRLSVEEEEVEKCKRVERLANQEVHQCHKKFIKKKDDLTDLGDMLEQPKKELEMAKDQESRRRLKMETFRKEIEVCVCDGGRGFFLSFGRKRLSASEASHSLGCSMINHAIYIQ